MKTCVTGELHSTYNRLVGSMEGDMDGMIVLFVKADDEVRLVIFYIPRVVVEGGVDVVGVMERRIKEKGEEEGFKEFRILDMESALLFESLMLALDAKESARRTEERVKKLEEKVERNYELLQEPINLIKTKRCTLNIEIKSIGRYIPNDKRDKTLFIPTLGDLLLKR